MFIGIVVLAIVAAWIVITYNGFIRGSNEIKNAWGQISVQLKRRHELIPNLVECVKGYMQYEKETLEKVIEARNQALNAKDVRDSVAAENKLTSSLHGLLAVVERYPELKANANMLSLQEELTSTENKVAFARQHYNDSILSFNTRCESFPSVIIAKIFSFKPYEYFQISEAEEAAPKVKF
ncbi:LemA family protein [bacterium]|nr:LemA family protein [bacterium]